jgi:hypothetical protein
MKNATKNRTAESYNPDDAANDYNDMKGSDYDEETELMWQPVYDAIDAAADAVRRETGEDVTKVTDYRKLTATVTPDNSYAVRFDDDGNLRVSYKFVMVDPDDEDFGVPHLFIKKLGDEIPRDFILEYAYEDERGGSRQKFIASKMVVRRFDPDASMGHLFGDDGTTDYEVVETLVVIPKEQDKNPLQEADDANDAEEPVAETDTDAYICDFPSWALDYVVNAELGSVSRQEKQMIDGWTRQMRAAGYDPDLASYSEEEFFSSQPEFGLPCDCVTATVPKKAFVAEAEDQADPVAKYLRFD